MNKKITIKQATQEIANGKHGIWTDAANMALNPKSKTFSIARYIGMVEDQLSYSKTDGYPRNNFSKEVIKCIETHCNI